MKLDPVTGPIPRAEFAEIIAAPYGEAVKRIRKYDPFWAREPGEKLKWRVEAQREIRGVERGHANVIAETKEEAEQLADKLKDAEFSWGDADYDYEGDIISIEVEPLP